MDPSAPSLHLPAGYTAERELARRPGVRVLLARRGAAQSVLRIEASGAETLTELAVLSRVRHPVLARLIDHGPLPGGGRYVAREWIEGAPLSEAALDLDAPAIGRIAARIAQGLAAMHAEGFVHGDLKPDNVLIRPDGTPLLVDYGLARRTGERTEAASGTVFYVSPEALVGRPIDERADLFSLGALLLALLAPSEITAREFYGRFPAQPYLEAVGVDVERLPAWARDVVVGLLERDPDRRPGATWVASLLASRLGGVPDVAAASELRLQWPALEGREAFVTERMREWSRPECPRAEVWHLFDAREVPRVADALALHLALHGRSAVLVDLAAELSALRTGLDLDAWARDHATIEETTVFVVQGASGSPWRARALTILLRALEQRARSGGARASGHRLVAIEPAQDAAPIDAPVTAFDVPGCGERDVQLRLETWLPNADRTALTTLAERLDAEARGSTVRLEERVRALFDDGWIRPGPEGFRLRPGPLPAHLGRTSRGVAERYARLGPDARGVAAALLLAPRPLTDVQLAARTGLDAAALLAALDALRGAELVRRVGDATQLRALPRPEALDLAPAQWAAHHARAAADRDAPAWRVALHTALARPDDAQARAEFLAALQDLRQAGATELAVEALGLALEGPGAPPPSPVLVAERAHSFAVLGERDLALERIAALEDERDPLVRARIELTRSQVATLSGDAAAALEHARAAARLDPALESQVLLNEARALLQDGHDAELRALLDTWRDRPLPTGARKNLDACEAMLAFRSGDPERARTSLLASLEDGADLLPAQEAPARLNLAVVERHVGNFAEAERHLRRALELRRREGHPARLTQVQLALGALQRDEGLLLSAQKSLTAAVEGRERLGDHSGAERARGVLGLTLLERGHLRAAISLLEEAAAHLGGGAEGEWLLARATEARARIGEPVSVPPLGAKDPRVEVARARTAALTGDRERALAGAHAAREAAASLGRATVEVEARELLERMGVAAPGPDGGTPSPWTLLTADERCAPDLFAAAEAAQSVGRDDEAARLALAAASTEADPHKRKTAANLAREAFARCAAGLATGERQALRLHLFGLPDPRPDDLNALEDEGDLDMDVLTLLDINQRLVDQEDLPRLLGEIVEHALTVTGAQRGFLVLEEDGELSLDLALDSRRGDIDEPEVELSHSIVRQALDEGAALRLSNAAQDPILAHAPSVAALDLRSVLCQPFAVQDGLRGVIYVDNRMAEGSFDARAERLLGLLAGQAALAIRQVRRLEEIRRLNRELEREVEHKESDLRAAHRALRERGVQVPVHGIIGDSPAMLRVHELLRRVAPAQLPVLVSGPSGTGKELAARALHDLSERKEGPFVSENCAALPASIIESELFGFVKGAFTGADRDREGLFERANGGTLFLDEVGELPLELQAKLLRVLETREVRRLGSTAPVPVDFRLVAATNRELATEVREGRFREDLMYRLDAVRIEMPPLAERLVDVPALVDHFLRLNRTRDGVARRCSPEVLRRLMAREWPGNVRELSNEIARLCVLSDGDLADPDLVRDVPATSVDRTPVGEGAIVTISELEKRAILRAIEATGGDKRRAAELLGISRAKIYQRLKEWEEGA